MKCPPHGSYLKNKQTLDPSYLPSSCCFFNANSCILIFQFELWSSFTILSCSTSHNVANMWTIPALSGVSSIAGLESLFLQKFILLSIENFLGTYCYWYVLMSVCSANRAREIMCVVTCMFIIHKNVLSLFHKYMPFVVFSLFAPISFVLDRKYPVPMVD